MKERLRTDTNIAVDNGAENIPPAFVVQAFTLADGRLRYHVQAEWRAGREKGYGLVHTFAAWMAAEPTLRILAVDRLTFGSDAVGERELLNVVDLGDDRTGIVIRESGGDGMVTRLVDYSDDVSLSDMPTLQAISFGE